LDFLAPAQQSDELGRLGPYRVLKVLGAGGMGLVLLAEDPHLERLVALKVILPEVAAKVDARQRFLREARATAKVKDDHVVTIFQVGEDRGVAYLAMEYLHGESLESWLHKGARLAVTQILRLAREMTQGLAAAHAQGLVHHDIKPGNLWLEAPRGRVKILDFGLARGGLQEVQLTQSGVILGTPSYMAPEQGQGEPADTRSDLFSLGCVLYRLCTGRVPFEGLTVMAVLTALATRDPRPVREVNPEIPEALAGLVMRLLARHREDRPASAEAVLVELQAIEHQQASASPSRTAPVSAAAAASEPASQTLASVPVAAPEVRQRRWVVGLVAVLLLAGAVGLGPVVLRITGPDGKQTEVSVPDGSKVAVNAKGEVDIRLPGAAERRVPETGSPLDRLDPAQIPAEERFAWQPKELVAVLGEHRQRLWNYVAGLAVTPDGKQLVACAYDTPRLHFWDAMTLGEQGAVHVIDDGSVYAVAYDPAGEKLAFAAMILAFSRICST
jgi:predicted Ser/Thr protein kinase